MKTLILIVTTLCLASGTLLSPEVERRVLDHHNKLRRGEGSSDMKEMKWDPTLAQTASMWADGCVFKHGHPTSVKTNYGYVGQNIFWSSSESVDAVDGIQKFFDEKKDYIYSQTKCRERAVCGHYTQVVWADSEYVGCAATVCSGKREEGKVSGTLMVCNYGPGGNYRGAKPFKVGRACSECETGYRCRNDLCYKP
uniref:SCP domain-containing protein n=1 Tax=Hirudo nipponia TaxID=42736 RepID=A0AAF0YZ94_HIRNI|nr:hypothetical protein [Hirudo nipponia]